MKSENNTWKLMGMPRWISFTLVLFLHLSLHLSLHLFLPICFGTMIPEKAMGGEASRASLVVVAAIDFNMSKLTKEEAEAIFLQKRVAGPGQQAFVPVFLPDSSADAIEFADKVLGKSVKQLRAYWNLKVLTGRLKPPIVVETTEEMINYLSRNHGSLGYLNEASVKDGLKVLYKGDGSR
ncbi:MAG: hypothetical protein WCI18_11460 [Pseudomonadota bacterium]